MLHRWANTRQERKRVSKKCHGRSFTQTTALKTKTGSSIKKKNINSSRCFVSFCKLWLRKHTVRKLQSLTRLVVRGSPLRTHTHGSSNEISTMNSVTEYPTSTIDKIRPQTRGGPANHRRAPSGRCRSQPIAGRDPHPRGGQASLGHS